MYAYFKKLDYFSTECIYAPFAARGLARDFVKDLEVIQDSLLTLNLGSYMPEGSHSAATDCAGDNRQELRSGHLLAYVEQTTVCWHYA